MSTIIKTNSSNKIITINNNKYIPFQLHQLPKYYQEIELTSQFKLNGLIYININSLEALSEVHNEEHYYNHELSNACHELRMKLIPMIQECHDEENKYKSILDD
jgi:hypothetical protein